jgi:hypothetical protein
VLHFIVCGTLAAVVKLLPYHARLPALFPEVNPFALRTLRRSIQPPATLESDFYCEEVGMDERGSDSLFPWEMVSDVGLMP